MILEALLLGTLTITSYRPVPAQTDASPTWTSIGDRTTKFGCAVSQDLLKSGKIHYGDILYIEGYGTKVVNDTMHPRHKNAIDMLVFTHDEEKAVGTRHLKVWKLSANEALAMAQFKLGGTK
jgi:3D (Asp-Asp-Asp) domain-containing protein